MFGKPRVGAKETAFLPLAGFGPVGYRIPEVVHHEKTGLLCPAGDSSAFAEAIARLLADPDLRQRLGAAGRELVFSCYSSTAMCERTEAFYERLASAK